MGELTYQLAKTSFKKLKKKHQEILKFKNLEDMLQELGESGSEVINAGENSFLTRKVQTKNYEKGNITIVEVLEKSDFNRLIYPSFHL